MLSAGLLLVPCCLGAAQLKFDELKIGARTYTNVIIIGANTTDLYFTYDRGIANVKLKYVDPALQKRFDYDPKAAAEAERQQEEEDARYYESIASNAVARLEVAAREAQKAARTSPESLADPISDKSLLGKPAPTFAGAKWLGEKSAFEGKSVLFYFWAPWSIPCRKYIGVLNGLQKKFAEKLAVVGVSAESEAEVAEMTDPKLEFASALDPKAKFTEAAGVASIPSVLLVDPKGIVRYQGHPGALNEKQMESILAKAGE